MDNFSEEKEENELAQEDSKNAEVEDIRFEDTLDIDEIQQKLIEKIENDDDDEEILFEDSSVPDELVLDDKSLEETFTPPKTELPAKIENNSKKYVIYIDYENIEFMEGLSIKDRRKIINKILKEQNSVIEDKKKKEKRTELIKHVLIACVTFIIGFPILFLLVNFSAEVTIDNYRQAKENFAKLYKQQGKIKEIKPAAMRGGKY